MKNHYNSGRARQIPIWKYLFSIFFMVLTYTVSNAQVTTNSGSGLAPAYPDLATAITALNGAVISSPVIITLVGNETAPVGGYSITAQGTLANTILIQGNGSTITTPTTQVSGVLTDAVFKLVGADYVTLQNFRMQEDALNLTTAAATNNMTEWGVALLYATATNGSQNNTIQNNTISLNRVYQNTFGIYSNTRHSAILVTTIADVTSATGANSFNKVYGNVISNVNYGTVFIGSGAVTASSFMDNGNDTGGSSALTGNTYTNWGGIGVAASAYVSLTGSNYCVFHNNQYNDNISFNTITSFASASGLTMGGILKNYSTGTTAQPTGIIATTINNNTITITNNPTVVGGTIIGINNQGLSPFLSTATMSINNNTVKDFISGGGVVTTGAVTGIANLSIPGTLNMNNNTVYNLAMTATTSTTSAVTGLSNSGAAGTVNMNSNVVYGLSSSATTSGQLQGVVNSGAALNAINMNNNRLGSSTNPFATRTSIATTISGSLFGVISSNGIAATCVTSIQNNEITGINYAAPTTGNHSLIQNTGACLSANISDNKFYNLSVNATTGTFYLINNNSSTNNFTVNNNAIIGSFTKTGAGGVLYGYYNFGSPTGGTATITNNIFSNITFTGATTFYGIRQYTSVTQIENISNNTVANVTGGSNPIFGVSHGYGAAGSIVNGNAVNTFTGSGSITGINLGDNTAGTVNCYSNTVHNLTSTGAFAVSGISNTLGLVTNVYKNKVYNLEANNASGSVNGVLVASGTTVSLYNNIIGDLRTPNANAANPLNGINITGGTTVNAYNNTVMLNASSTGALFGSSAVSVSTTPTVSLRNNIFVNNSTVAGTGLAVAYRRSTTTLTSYDAVSNNNLFFASNIFTDGTNTDATLAAYQTRVATRDALSVTENPVFASTVGANANYLHIDTGIATLIESGGAAIGTITDDFDGDIRQGNVGYTGTGTAPDIGADESELIVLSINPFDLKSTFKAYPNPVSSLLNIEFTSDLTNVSVFNLLGQEVLSRKVSTTSTQIDLSSLNAGTYLVKVEAGSVSKTLKVFKK